MRLLILVATWVASEPAGVSAVLGQSRPLSPWAFASSVTLGKSFLSEPVFLSVQETCCGHDRRNGQEAPAVGARCGWPVTLMLVSLSWITGWPEGHDALGFPGQQFVGGPPPGERGCFWGGKLGWGVSVGSVPMSLPGLHHHGPEPRWLHWQGRPEGHLCCPG